MAASSKAWNSSVKLCLAFTCKLCLAYDLWISAFLWGFLSEWVFIIPWSRMQWTVLLIPICVDWNGNPGLVWLVLWRKATLMPGITLPIRSLVRSAGTSTRLRTTSTSTSRRSKVCGCIVSCCLLITSDLLWVVVDGHANRLIRTICFLDMIHHRQPVSHWWPL